MTQAVPTRPMLRVLVSVAGLVVWAGHFTLVYAVTALACERGTMDRSLWGLPWVQAVVGIATVLALVTLALLLRPALREPRASLTEGGEAEPRFTHWVAAVTASISALAVVFQAIPALLLPECGW